MKAYIGMGANIGNPEKTLHDAVAALDLVPGIQVDAVSDWYITKPVGYDNQPDFTNLCVKIETSLSPEAVLGVCLGMEAAFGRVREIKNGPRVLDMDVLLYEKEERNTKELVLPHPRMFERGFVLIPLMDVMKEEEDYYSKVKESAEKYGSAGVNRPAGCKQRKTSGKKLLTRREKCGKVCEHSGESIDE